MRGHARPNRSGPVSVLNGMGNGIEIDATDCRDDIQQYKGHIITAANGVFRIPEPGHRVWISAFDSREAAMDCIDRMSGPRRGAGS